MPKHINSSINLLQYSDNEVLINKIKSDINANVVSSILINEEFNIIYCNSAFGAGLLYEKNELLNSNFKDYFELENKEHYIKTINSIFQSTNDENGIQNTDLKLECYGKEMNILS